MTKKTKPNYPFDTWEETPFEDAPELDDWESITETEEEDWGVECLTPAQRSPSLLQNQF